METRRRGNGKISSGKALKAIERSLAFIWNDGRNHEQNLNREMALTDLYFEGITGFIKMKITIWSSRNRCKLTV